jgi:hypothetical protein
MQTADESIKASIGMAISRLKASLSNCISTVL